MSALSLRDTPLKLDELSTSQLSDLLGAHTRSVALLPLGSVEPHGPHMPLATDRLLSEESAARGALQLRGEGVCALVAPPIAYGVTDFAEGFCGAISLPQTLFVELMIAVVEGYLKAGFQHVCMINHHLEPGQLAGLKEAHRRLAEAHGAERVSAPLVVSRRWGRALGAEFKSGACHAGAYEGSMILCSHPSLFQAERAQALPPLEVSLSEAISRGAEGFLAIGMTEAYTGTPSEASAEEGERLYTAHAEMIATEVREALEGNSIKGHETKDR